MEKSNNLPKGYAVIPQNDIEIKYIKSIWMQKQNAINTVLKQQTAYKKP